MNAKLTLNSVAKSFGDNQVLRDISLTINTGEVVSFIGASGSGKTTLLRCINLLETVDSGSILLDNTEITAVGLDPNPIRRRIGIVFQSFNLFPHLSIRRNVTLALTEVLDKSADDANETATNLLARFEADARAKGAQLVTTEKDAVRLPSAFRTKAITLPVRLQFEDDSALQSALKKLPLT